MAGAPLSAALPVDALFSLRYEYDSPAAPIRKGETVGRALLICEGETVASCPLVAAGDVAEWSFGEALRSVLRNWLPVGRVCLVNVERDFNASGIAFIMETSRPAFCRAACIIPPEFPPRAHLRFRRSRAVRFPASADNDSPADA